MSGFVSDNAVWLDQGAAVVVLTNRDGSEAASSIANQIGPLLLAEKQDAQAEAALAEARRLYSDLQEVRIDGGSLLTSDADAYFTQEVLADARSSLKPLGAPESFEQTGFQLRDGMSYRHFRIHFGSGKTLRLSTFSTPHGKLAQYLIQ